FEHAFSGGFHRDIGERRLEPRLREAASHRDEIGGRADHFDRAVVVPDDVLGARVERGFHHVFLARPRREHELAAVLEEERDRAVGAEVAAVLGERVAHLRDGAGAVVGHAIHHHRGAARPVALVADLLVGGALQAARAALRSALDRVLGHVRVVRLVDREAQPRVHRRIGPAQTRGHRDLLDEPREDLALLGVRRRFLVLYVGPSGMSCHGRAARLEFGKAYNFIIRFSRRAKSFHDRTLAVTPRASYRAVGVAMAIAGVVCFSLRPILIKLAYGYVVDPITLLALRMIFSLPFFLAAAAWVGRNATRNPVTRRDVWAIAFLGFIGYYFASFVDFLGLRYVSAGLGRLILFMYPTLVVLLSIVFLHKRPSIREIVALVLTYSGIALVITTLLGDGNANLPLGASLCFASATGYAVYLVAGSQVVQRVGSIRFTAYAT